MGLFTGFSVISMFELLFWMGRLIRWVVPNSQSNPETQSNESDITNQNDI